MSRPEFLFGLAALMLLLLATLVQGEGMNEVFKWKQMDFYNRGDGAHNRPRQPDPSGEHQEKRERDKKKQALSSCRD